MATPEAAEFAALLKELKDRSGRSYGVLAGRLHVSTSTLHRYCNGDAVPNEYAPVERLARLCEATPDELVELHRRWIVAEAARRRTKTEAATPVPAPVSEAVVPSVPPGRAPAPAVDGEKDADQGPEPGTAAAEGTSPRWFRSTPRMRVLLAAAAVVALTVPTTLIVSDLNVSGSGSDLSDAPAEVDGVGGAAQLPDDDASELASPSAHKPSGTPGDSGIPSASSPATGGAATSGGQGAGARKQGSGGAAPDVTISSYNWEAPCGQHYLLDQKPDSVPPPPAPQDTRGWAKALGGVDGGDMLLELTVQGRSGQAVVLHGLHVRVLSREAPLAWPAYSMGEGCGGGITPQSFDVDLDDNRPTLTPVAGEHAGTPVPPKDFPFRVTSTDVEVFDLDAHVEGHDVSWYLELEWSSGGNDGTLRIDDGGKPFRTSSIKARPQYSYVNDTARWSTG
ncbi:plasmid maintenance system antidote protein VapI [Streptomyces atratus]|uniref:transcriptional regulator n=1 Tax=Streptomyces atratus TaxID=1893 RepID=UPI003398AD06